MQYFFSASLNIGPVFNYTQQYYTLPSSFQRPLFVLVDRNVDMATPLHHTWTYQALIHDVLVRSQSPVWEWPEILLLFLLSLKLQNHVVHNKFHGAISITNTVESISLAGFSEGDS